MAWRTTWVKTIRRIVGVMREGEKFQSWAMKK